MVYAWHLVGAQQTEHLEDCFPCFPWLGTTAAPVALPGSAEEASIDLSGTPGT